jgi:GNAT superfamily N-acetyltransferase
MSITYNESLPLKDQYYELFESSGWNEDYQFTPEEVYQAIKNSWYMVSVFDGEQLVGYGRVISDGIHHALIVDMIILPEYQGKGIGTEILDMLVKRCQENRVRDIQLFCAKGKFPFYGKYGFEERPQDAPGMEIKLKMEPVQ